MKKQRSTKRMRLIRISKRLSINKARSSQLFSSKSPIQNLHQILWISKFNRINIWTLSRTSRAQASRPHPIWTAIRLFSNLPTDNIRSTLIFHVSTTQELRFPPPSSQSHTLDISQLQSATSSSRPLLTSKIQIKCRCRIFRACRAFRILIIWTKTSLKTLLWWPRSSSTYLTHSTLKRDRPELAPSLLSRRVVEKKLRKAKRHFMKHLSNKAKEISMDSWFAQ